MIEMETRPRETPPPQPARGAPRRPLRWPTLVLALAVIGGALWLGRSTAVRTPDTETQATTVAADSERPVSDAASSSREPVAVVARRLSRSVVQIETTQGLGSGVIYDSDGLILTAAHVVSDAGEVVVRLPSGERLDGAVVGADPETDVAVVRIDRSNLPAAKLATDVTLRVGQTAIAIGSPFGLEGSVTAGVVSAVDRSITTEGGTSTSMVQTDASINPGNSGGALADGQGRVIGINDAIRSDSGVNSGVGFAIPIDVAVTVAESLVRGESPEFGFLGIGGTDPSSGPAGALVTAVTDGSGADSAGLQEGDVITSFNGEPIEGMSELAARIRATTAGEVVLLEVLRGERPLTIEAEIGTR